LILSLATLSSCVGGGAGVTIGQLAALSGVLDQLQKALSSVVAQADDATKNRVSQVDTAARDNIDRINKVVAHAADSTSEQREELARQAFGVLADSQKIIDQSGKDLFANVNQTLASSAAILDAIPFVKIPDTVFGVTPYKIHTDTRSTEVSIYGYFPSIAENASAVVVTLGGEAVPVKRSVGRIFFDLPDNVLKQTSRLVDVRIQLPKKGWFSSTPTPIDTRIRLLSNTPYSFSIDAMKDNPAAYATVTGRAHMEGANSSNTNRNVHIDAVGLFNTSVGDPRYDASTAQIVGVAPQPSGSGKACADCPDPSGSITSWNASAVEVALNAPNCGNHFVQTWSTGPFGIRVPGGYVCGGGGSHFEVIFIPTFTVHVQGAPDSTPISTIPVKAGWAATSTVDLPPDWNSAVIKLSYDDNFDKSDTLVVLKKAVPTASVAMFDARVENNKLYLSTR
jgi:hypothetical protein